MFITYIHVHVHTHTHTLYLCAQVLMEVFVHGQREGLHVIKRRITGARHNGRVMVWERVELVHHVGAGGVAWGRKGGV